jgi:hypothetical protein
MSSNKKAQDLPCQRVSFYGEGWRMEPREGEAPTRFRQREPGKLEAEDRSPSRGLAICGQADRAGSGGSGPTSMSQELSHPDAERPHRNCILARAYPTQ